MDVGTTSQPTIVHTKERDQKEQTAMRAQNPLSPPVPYSIEAEEAVLGSMLLDPDCAARLTSQLKAQDFHREKHQWIFDGLKRLISADSAVDTLLLSDELQTMGHLEAIGGPVALTELYMRVPTAIHADYYASIVQRNALLRRMIGAAEQVAKLAYQTEEGGDAIALRGMVDRIFADVWGADIKGGPVHLREAMAGAIDLLDRLMSGDEPPYTPSALSGLSSIIGGYFEGEQTVIAGRTGMGKSSLAGYEALHFAKMGKKVLYVSIEMSDKSLAGRFLATHAGISHRVFRTGAKTENATDTQKKVHQSSEEMDNFPLYILDMPGASLDAIRAHARTLAAKLGGLDFIVTDYLGLMKINTSHGAQPRDLIGDNSRGLRELARELKCHSLLLHQLSRESVRDGRPALHHLADSGKIEYDADVVLGIHDPDPKQQRTAAGEKRELLILKQRNGESGGAVPVLFQGATQRWFCVDDHTPEPEPVYQPQRQTHPPYQGQQQRPRPPAPPVNPSVYDEVPF